MLSDLRFVLRGLFRNRTFTLITVLTLALGIGSAAAIFSVSDWLLFRANEFPDRVYLIGGQSDRNGFMPVRFDYMAAAYEHSEAIDSLVRAAQRSGNVVINDQPVGVGWLGVTPNFFEVLGIKPPMGRAFLPDEAKEGADQVLVITDRFWRQHLAGTSDVLGRKVTVGNAVCTVVGVLRPDQILPAYVANDIIRPLVYHVNPRIPWDPMLWLLARIRPGVTREQARDMLAAAKVEVPGQIHEYVGNDRVVLSTLPELNSRYLHPELYWMLLGAVGFLYAIACLNASNLVLVRMLGQRRELSIRLALGGGRWRIIRLLTLESAMLAVLGALVGALVANWLFPLLLRATGSPFMGFGWDSWTLGWRVIAVMGLLAVLTSGFIVAIPAVRILKSDIYAGLKDGGASLGESRALARLRGTFVVLQTAFAIVLLCGAALMVRTIQKFQNVDLGIDASDKLKLFVALPPDTPAETEVRLTRLRNVQTALLHVPGVRAAGFGNDIILPGYAAANTEVTDSEGKVRKVNVLSFGQGFETAAGLRLLRGDWLSHKAGDHVLVSESLARAFWPGKDPIGQHLRTTNTDMTKVGNWKGWYVEGVVRDVRSTMRESPVLSVYGPETWAPFNFMTFMVRLSRPYDAGLAGNIRRELYAFDPQLVVLQVLPLSEVRDQQLAMERMADSVLRVLAGIAALLTVVGIFSVLAYTVDRRMSEFGVRMALGASRRDVIALVVRRGLMLAVIGLLIGLGVALALTRYLQSLLFQTSAQDPLMLATVTLVIVVTAVLACALPAYRASKADIARLLRSE